MPTAGRPGRVQPATISFPTSAIFVAWTMLRAGIDSAASGGTAVQPSLIAILPCNNLDRSQAFFERLGFKVEDGSLADYRMMADGLGGQIHLNHAVEGWLVSGQNPFGLYLCREDVDELAAVFRGELLGNGDPSDKPWGMYEFALNGPDDVLVRVGWPTRLR